MIIFLVPLILCKGGETALTMACSGGKLEIAKFLIDNDGNQKAVKNKVLNDMSNYIILRAVVQ